MDVAEMLSHDHSQEKKVNGSMLMIILQIIQFLGRQGLPLRGHISEESNFIRLMRLRAHDNPQIHEWLSRKADKYTSPEIQNEILMLMSHMVLRNIATCICRVKYFTIMADECVDISNNEQLVICFRYIDETLAVHEEFMGLYMCDNIKSDTIVKTLEDVMLRFDLKLSNCRGQCYDGGSNMAGSKNGVKTQLLAKEPRALYMHCYGHALSLSVCDAIKMIPLLRSTMDTVHEISKLLQYSPKRSNLFTKLKEEISPDTVGFRVLCPTRWTIRHETLSSIMSNYETFFAFWEEILEDRLDSETRARVHGLNSQMRTFNFYFGLKLLHTVLMHADNLSRTLQSTKMSAAEGQHIARLTLTTLSKIRSSSSYLLFWDKAKVDAQKLEIDGPVLPRKRKPPRDREVGSGEGDQSSLPVDYYRSIYYETLDTVMASVTDRFDQEGYSMYRKVESILLQKDISIGAVDEILSLYKDDFSRDLLISQLQLFYSNYSLPSANASIHDVITLVKGFSTAEKDLMSQVVTLVQLLLVMPATNAISERSFSAMRRIKTYLRSTMLQERLNATMVLHVHKESTDALNLQRLSNEFVSKSDYRKSKFPMY